ncbi:MAG: hypothetical protein B6D62_03075 [Candidatus Cloacimonas sp. 4484_275]|jgi:predicted metal-dependent phosphoesterase TrpH|nr:MAG: hypothetical protein B6D62_03075 [Candidatus Cloacimonas sp. 4484_275]
MKKIDLHIHTGCSDGIFSVEEVLDLAEKYEYDEIAITDHDTIEGYKKALEIMKIKEYRFKLIPGVEISCSQKNQDVHMLAYYFDTQNQKLLNLLNSIQNGRFVRAQQILSKLERMGIKINFARVQEIAGKNGLIGRPHIARALIEIGCCSSIKEVFEIYLGENCPANVPKPAPNAKKAIKTIHKAGGLAILAHPFTLDDQSVIYDLINFGLDGIEVFYTKHSEDKIEYYNEIALKNNLVRTGGSDFHGDGLDLMNFGYYSAPEFVSEELLQKLKKIRREN